MTRRSGLRYEEAADIQRFCSAKLPQDSSSCAISRESGGQMALGSSFATTGPLTTKKTTRSRPTISCHMARGLKALRYRGAKKVGITACPKKVALTVFGTRPIARYFPPE